MAQFKVGGKVVCIEDRTITSSLGNIYKIKRGEIYTVQEIDQCVCGLVALHIGFVKPVRPGVSGVVNCKCGATIHTQAVFIRSTSFAPIEEQEFKQVTYTKILDEIPVCAQ